MITRAKIVHSLITLILLIGAAFMLFPLFWAFLASLKSTTTVFDFGLPEKWLFSNYVDALRAGNWLRYFANSAIMAGGIAVSQTFLGAMAGYSLALRSDKEIQPLVNVLDQEGNLVLTMGVDDYPESQPFLRAI